MERFGFDSVWINIIKSCISSPRFSVMVNGSLCGFVNVSNGLCSGDLIYPFLFLTMAEAMSRYIRKLRVSKVWKGILVTDDTVISHSQFADDTVLFGEASLKEVEIIKSVIDLYAAASDQICNKDMLAI